jgi:hypothetical protein
MCFKSDMWMRFLRYYKTKFDNENIKLKIGHNKTAVLIEPRLDTMIELVIKNFMYFLHKDWNLMIICGTKNKDYILSLTEMIGDIIIVDLQIDNLSISQYNSFCLSKELYNSIPTENILFFQIDTLLRKPIPDDYLKYAYVGAPWRPDLSWFHMTNGIGNGGLSLRRKSYMLSIIENYNKNNFEANNMCKMPEDIIIGMMCKKMNLPMPTFQQASCFSVETVMNNDPIGIHKPSFTENQIKHLLQV